MQELELEPYEPLWQGMDIRDLRSLAGFIGRPYAMFCRIVEYVRTITPDFPYVVHTCYDEQGAVVAMIEKLEGVVAIITG
jgi:hypothetical protein